MRKITIHETEQAPDRAQIVATVLATAVVRSPVYREYLHLVRTDDGWKIVNALWDWA